MSDGNGKTEKPGGLAVQSDPVALPQARSFVGPLSGDPKEVLAKATEIAKALQPIVRNNGLSTRIGDKDHVHVEGWTTMCAMLGIFPRTDWTRPLPAKNGTAYEARVTFVHLATGHEVSSGEAMCSPDEEKWAGRDEFQVRSMAATRAASKGARIGFSWIMVLAGYAATPAEEIDGGGDSSPKGKWVEATEDEKTAHARKKKKDLPQGFRWKVDDGPAGKTFTLQRWVPASEPKAATVTVESAAPVAQSTEPPATGTTPPVVEAKPLAGDPLDLELGKAMAAAGWTPAQIQVKANRFEPKSLGDWRRLNEAQKEHLLSQARDAAAAAVR